MSTQPESRLQRKIREALEAEWPTSWWTKFHGGPFTKAGVPDLIGCVDGRMCALEVKMPDGEVSPVQRRRQAHLERAGAIVAVVTTADEAIDVVRRALTPPTLTPAQSCGFQNNTPCARQVGHAGKCWE
jgi:hypothetical protein